MEHRDLFVQRSGKTVIGQLVQDLMVTGGSIIDMSYTTNSFRPEKVHYWSVIFRVVFPDHESLEAFHNLGWHTSTVAKVAVGRLANDDDDDE